MTRTWPSFFDGVRVSARMLGEAVLLVLLTATLGFSARDGAVGDAYNFDVTGPAPSGIALLQVSGNNLSGKPGRSYTLPVVQPAPPPQPSVPTAPPVQLLIATLDVHRAVEKVGVNSSGVMNVPVNSWNAGWYKGSAVPGAPGDAVIEGHAGYPGKPMIFGKLVTLQPGAQVIVVLSDRTRRLFVVVSKEVIPVGSAPSGFAEPYGLPRLTLITCTGYFDKGSYSYSQRLAVELRYAGLV